MILQLVGQKSLSRAIEILDISNRNRSTTPLKAETVDLKKSAGANNHHYHAVMTIAADLRAPWKTLFGIYEMMKANGIDHDHVTFSLLVPYMTLHHAVSCAPHHIIITTTPCVCGWVWTW